MEKGIISYIRKQFELKEVDIHTYSPLTLAYIGDGIFDLIVRTVVVGRGNANVGNLHKKTSHVVKAQTQAKMIGQLLPYLTEEEADIYRRGRNAHSLHGRELLAHVAADALGGRRRVDELGVGRLQLAQLAHERVEGRIGEHGRVERVVEIGVVLDLATQRLDAGGRVGGRLGQRLLV